MFVGVCVYLRAVAMKFYCTQASKNLADDKTEDNIFYLFGLVILIAARDIISKLKLNRKTHHKRKCSR